MTTLTLAAAAENPSRLLVSLDWKLTPDSPAEAAQQAALVERGYALAEGLLAALRALPEMKSVVVEKSYGSTRVKMSCRGITHTWSFEVYRSSRGERYADCWSIRVNYRRPSRIIREEKDDSQITVYGQDGRDANPAVVAAKVGAWLVANHQACLDGIAERAARTHREKVAQAATVEDGLQVKAGWESGYEVSLKVADEEKLAKLQAFLATL